MPLEGLQLGHYRLLRLLGSGGMGEVYLAEDTSINRQVAIKVIRTEASAYPSTDSAKESARLFQREVKAISGLDHPNILPLFDYGEEKVNEAILTYMVMPYRQENSLATWLEKRGNSALLSSWDVAHFIRQAASALQYAHDHQIIHQDVKPSNFLIRNNADNPDRPDLLLADFGVAKNRRNITGISYCQRRQNGSNIQSKYSFSSLYSRLSRNPGTYQTPGLIERQKHAISWPGSTCCTC